MDGKKTFRGASKGSANVRPSLGLYEELHSKRTSKKVSKTVSNKSSKNSSKETKNIAAHVRGLHAENLVRDYFMKRGYEPLYHQKKIFGVEFDWIFKNPRGLLYVEVKSVRHPDFFIQRWPWKQKQRFLRVAAALAEQQRALFYLAMVDYENAVHLFRVGSEIQSD